ncbi:MAG: hypothetical protein ACYTGH_12590 [Planctomycetota bacterium]|jgi:Tfp pilus assembly protein PilV
MVRQYSHPQPFVLLESLLAAFVLVMILGGLVAVLVLKQQHAQRTVVEAKARLLLQGELARLRVDADQAPIPATKPDRFTPAQPIPSILHHWTWSRTGKRLPNGATQVILTGMAPHSPERTIACKGVVYER